MNHTIRFSENHQVEANLSSFGMEYERGMYCVCEHELPAPAALVAHRINPGAMQEWEYLLPTTAVIIRNGPPPPGFVSIEGE